MELSRARGSEEVVEVKEEKTTMVADWDSPNLAEELVDRIWDMVKDWLRDREPAASDFFHYCLNLCDSRGEADEVRVWMLNLIAHFVAEDEKWLDSVHTAKDWRELALVSVDNWEVPPPLWLVRREEELKKKHEEEEKLKELKEEKEIDETKESLVTTSPLDLDWGKELPAPTPSVAAPSASMWRPWEENVSSVNLSAVQKRKRKSPAAAARSWRRLQMWQEKKEMARLMPEMRTTPVRRFAQQMRSTNLLSRIEGQHFDSGGSTIEALVEGDVESSVLYCNLKKTSLHPQ